MTTQPITYLKTGDVIRGTSVIDPSWTNIVVVEMEDYQRGIEYRRVKVVNTLPRSLFLSDLEHIESSRAFGSRHICWGDGSANISVQTNHYLPWPDSDGNPVSSQVNPVTVTPYLEGYHKKDVRVGAQPFDVIEVRGWRNYLCTFAHELDMISDHTEMHTKRNHVVVLPNANYSRESAQKWSHLWKFARPAIGHLWTRIKFFETFENENAAPKDGWTTVRNEIELLMEKMCIMCAHPFWPRQFLHNAPESSWRSALSDPNPDNQGRTTIILPGLNMETWKPELELTKRLTTVRTTKSAAEWHGDMIEQYAECLRYFDQHYASRD